MHISDAENVVIRVIIAIIKWVFLIKFVPLRTNNDFHNWKNEKYHISVFVIFCILFPFENLYIDMIHIFLLDYIYIYLICLEMMKKKCWTYGLKKIISRLHAIVEALSEDLITLRKFSCHSRGLNGLNPWIGIVERQHYLEYIYFFYIWNP